MLYCLDTYTIRDKGCIGRCCLVDNLDQKIRIAKAAGFDAVEIWDDDVKDFLDTHSQAELRELLDGLTVPSYKVLELYTNLCYGPDPDSTLYRAAICGAASVVTVLVRDAFDRETPTLQDVLSQFQYIAHKADRYGITLGLEFMANSPCYNTLADAVTVVRALEHPLARVVLDSFHIWKTGDNQFKQFAQDVDRLQLEPSLVSVVHLTDTCFEVPQAEQRDRDRRMPGTGQLNLVEFVRILHRIGYTGALSLGVYDKQLWDQDPAVVAVNGIQAMKAITKAACQ